MCVAFPELMGVIGVIRSLVGLEILATSERELAADRRKRVKCLSGDKE